MAGADSQSIDLLESRLRRLEHALGADNTRADEDDGKSKQNVDIKEHSITLRLSNLDVSLQQLCSKSNALQNLLQMQALYPDLFSSMPPQAKSSVMTRPELLAIVLSSATLYPLVTSRLTSIRDMPPASAETSTSLISLKPRIAEVQLLQDTQAREIAELQKASAALLERWYEVTVLGSGECWADWDKRRNDIDRGLRRLELSATKDDV